MLVSFLIGIVGSGIIPLAGGDINKKNRFIVFLILTIIYTIVTYFLFNSTMPDFKWEYLPGYLLISGIWWILSSMIGIGVKMLQ